MLEYAREAVSKHVPVGRVGVAFSGGVDSALLARLCHDAGRDIELLTVGLEGSHDIASAKEANESMGYPHHVRVLDPGSVRDAASYVADALRTDDRSWIENGAAFIHVSRLASELKLDVVAAANGLDELFCGYDAYRREYHMGERHLEQMIDERMDYELQMMDAMGAMASTLGVTLVQPFLSPEFAIRAKEIPIREKITGSEDMYRKHPVRLAAKEAGIPRISYDRRKKALQYGTGIHRTLRT